jgi:AcrR family transcriptional regulator
VVTAEGILAAASTLLDTGGDVTVRGVARLLGVDPMAVYHYYPDKRALLETSATLRMEGIYRPDTNGEWRVELRRLAASYLTLLARSPALLDVMILLGGSERGPVQTFRDRFRAVSPRMTPRREQAAVDLLVDYLHGFALAMRVAGPGVLDVRQARPALDLYLDALRPRARPAD